MLAMDVNDSAGNLILRGAIECIASKLAPTVIFCQATAVSAGETMLVLPPRDLPELRYSAIDS
ncbi:hypothetical protein EQV97_09055 [Pseudomonas sp. TMW22090]|nr:hypothetical protein [Pseudomonas sp. TMW22090]